MRIPRIKCSLKLKTLNPSKDLLGHIYLKISQGDFRKEMSLVNNLARRNNVLNLYMVLNYIECDNHNII